MGSGTKAQAGLTAYERQRQDNIERNAQRLQELGIPARTRVAQAPPSRAAHVKRPKPVAVQQREGTRKSARLESIPPVGYRELDGPPLKPLRIWQTGDEDYNPPPEVENEGDNEGDAKGDAVGPIVPQAAAPAAPGSLRTLDADLDTVDSQWLGKKVYPHGGGGAMKASVMALLAGTPGHPPRHNKYSGIQEWRNAVALTVNVRGKTGSLYDNLFLEGGKFMTWFAQPSQTMASPVIHRMLVSDTNQVEGQGSADEGKESGVGDGQKVPDPCPVILFCRQDGEAYVYCGRLRAISTQPTARPLKVIWEMVHWEELKKCEEFVELLGWGTAGRV